MLPRARVDADGVDGSQLQAVPCSQLTADDPQPGTNRRVCAPLDAGSSGVAQTPMRRPASLVHAHKKDLLCALAQERRRGNPCQLHRDPTPETLESDCEGSPPLKVFELSPAAPERRRPSMRGGPSLLCDLASQRSARTPAPGADRTRRPCAQGNPKDRRSRRAFPSTDWPRGPLPGSRDTWDRPRRSGYPPTPSWHCAAR